MTVVVRKYVHARRMLSWSSFVNQYFESESDLGGD